MKKILGIIIIAGIMTGCTLLETLTGPKVDPLRFADVVAGYKAADILQKPVENAVLFVGSSSIHGWKSLAADFPEVDVINRGMGGSHMSDLIYYLDDIVFAYQPNAMVVYEGDNDIAFGKSPERVTKDFKILVSKIRETWPEMPVFFISIKPSLARSEVMNNMARANALIRTHCDETANLYYVDVFTPMLGGDDTPRKDIFTSDGLHMNKAGYALWTTVLRKELGIE